MHFEASINPNNIRDVYLKEHVKIYEKKFGTVSINERFSLENKLLTKLLKKYSNYTFESYEKVEWGYDRSKIIEEALKQEKKQLTKKIETIFNPEKTKYTNVFLIDISCFEKFIETFSENPDIDWTAISRNTDIDWSLNTIRKGQYVLDYFELQLNPKTSKFFTDFTNIEEFKCFVDWKLISVDRRIKWTNKLIKKYKSNLTFTWVGNEKISKRCNYYNNCFINGGRPAGLSMSPNLNHNLIIENIENWDWELLSSNPIIIPLPIFESPINKYLNFYGLAHNSVLNIEILKTIKNLVTDDKNYDVISPINKSRFSWKYAFENAHIKWNKNNIKDFISILDNKSNMGGSNWDGISKKVSDKNLIIKYQDKLNFFNLTIESNLDNTLIWDEDLLKALLNQFKGKEITSGRFQVGLPDILKHIKIENQAILNFNYFWKNTYTYKSYHRNSDGTEEVYSSFPLWSCLKDNESVQWNPELDEAMRDQRYTINDEVKLEKSGKIGIIVANKSRPWETQTNGKSKVITYPSKSYLVLLFKNSKNDKQNFEGVLDIFEYEIDINYDS